MNNQQANVIASPVSSVEKADKRSNTNNDRQTQRTEPTMSATQPCSGEARSRLDSERHEPLCENLVKEMCGNLSTTHAHPDSPRAVQSEPARTAEPFSAFDPQLSFSFHVYLSWIMHTVWLSRLLSKFAYLLLTSELTQKPRTY